MDEIKTNTTSSLEDYVSFCGIKFASSTRAYFFGIKDGQKIEEGDVVVIETIRGIELGTVVVPPMDISTYKSDLGLKPIVRKATDLDKKINDQNIKDAKIALDLCQKEVNSLGLNMNLISCEYTLDRGKILFSYLADERVDFRELLKVLAAKLHTRIELRQIGTRDKAKMIGGIGVCGLPLCCSQFLSEFDGISISRAKNQMLAINIPKLSGHCGKLICCLKFEDEAYTEAKKQFPDLGAHVWIDKVEFTVTGMNVISGVIKVENKEDVKFLEYEDFLKQTNFHPKKEFKHYERKKEEKPDPLDEIDLEIKMNNREQVKERKFNNNNKQKKFNKKPNDKDQNDVGDNRNQKKKQKPNKFFNKNEKK